MIEGKGVPYDDFGKMEGEWQIGDNFGVSVHLCKGLNLLAGLWKLLVLRLPYTIDRTSEYKK